jgi:hypothetical protein
MTPDFSLRYVDAADGVLTHAAAAAVDGYKSQRRRAYDSAIRAIGRQVDAKRILLIYPQ